MHLPANRRLSTARRFKLFHLKLLGSASLRNNGFDGPLVVGESIGVAVLAYLATRSDRRARRGHLAKLLWPDRSEAAGRQRLRQALYYLRSEAGARFVEPGTDPLVLTTGRVSVDLWEFDRAMDSDRYEEAVQFYDGPFLDTFGRKVSREFRSWREAENARLRTSIKAAYQELVGSLIEEGEVDAAIRYAERWVDLNPLDADSEAALIRALLHAEDWTRATRAYERYRTLLRETVGERPDEDLRREIEEAKTRVGVV